MIIDIQRTILRKNLRAFILAIVFILIILLLLLTYLYEDQLFGLSNYHIAIIIAGIYVLYMLFNTLRQYYYVYFSDDNDKIILRYFPTSFFTHKKNAIEIPKKDFIGYEKKRWLFGFRENIILMVQTPRGIAKYPSVSLTALNKKEKESLYRALDRLKR
ncbi:MAG: hypothetical protein JXR41_07720 [Bacteroidales bacterium]|nr:hypothetical protein [Bacteroidales bacterium]MBN2762961.1 hypothetical protein [Bacteroidales bacterium]